MTIQEIAWFANHKYGENVYLMVTKQEVLILTKDSKWRILLSDMRRFGFYTLAHLNHRTDGIHYHVQCRGQNIDFLVYYAIMHDLNIGPYGKTEWFEFQRLWDMYKLGRQLEESCAKWAFLAGEDWYLNKECRSAI